MVGGGTTGGGCCSFRRRGSLGGGIMGGGSTTGGGCCSFRRRGSLGRRIGPLRPKRRKRLRAGRRRPCPRSPTSDYVARQSFPKLPEGGAPQTPRSASRQSRRRVGRRGHGQVPERPRVVRAQDAVSDGWRAAAFCDAQGMFQEMLRAGRKRLSFGRRVRKRPCAGNGAAGWKATFRERSPRFAANGPTAPRRTPPGRNGATSAVGRRSQ